METVVGLLGALVLALLGWVVMLARTKADKAEVRELREDLSAKADDQALARRFEDLFRVLDGIKTEQKDQRRLLERVLLDRHDTP